jgi:hypothetical protein
MADPTNDTFFIYVKQFVKELLNPLGLFELPQTQEEHQLTNLNSYYLEEDDEVDVEDLCSSHGDERTEEHDTVDEQDTYEIDDDSTYDHFNQIWFYR